MALGKRLLPCSLEVSRYKIARFENLSTLPVSGLVSPMPPVQTTPQLPDFSDRRCSTIVICGRFSRDSQVPTEGFTKAGHWQYFEYKRSGTSVRGIVGRTLPHDEYGPHFHI